MNTTSILIKTDPQIKSKAQKIASDMGLSLTSVLNRYLKHFITTQTITFTTEERPTDYLLETLKKSEEDIQKGNMSPSFDNAEDAIAWLNK